MNENKEIEEMERDLENCLPSDWFLLKTVDSDAHLVAKHFYNLGYRNCKDKVVLDKEEWKTVCDNISNAESQGRKINYIYGECLIENQIFKEELKQASELKAETIKLAKQKTAREFAKELKELLEQKEYKAGGSAHMMWTNTAKECVDELAKKYGVEVE